MTIALTPEIEKALLDQARRLGTTPEALALEALREKLFDRGPQPEPVQARDDWEARLLRLGTPCGVSLSHAAVSSEGLYE